MASDSIEDMADTTRIRFGLFDFDPATRELRREGVVVKLQSQPAQVLGLLLAAPGEVVSRESMRQALWGDKTFVDFDRGLNFCIAQIRSALGDSAESPRYVKTLPKRSYQFIAPTAVPAAAVTIPVQETEPARPTRRSAWLAIPAVAAIAGAAYVTLSPKPPTRVAIARFDNHTGDPAFDNFAETLADSFIAELTTTGATRLAVIGNDPILRRSRTLRDVPAIGKALDVRFVILGSLERNTAGINVFVQLIRLPDQAHVGVARLSTGEGTSLKAPATLAQQVIQRFIPRLT